MKEVKGIYIFSYFSIRGILVFFCGLWRCRKSVLGCIKNLSKRNAFLSVLLPLSVLFNF